TAEFIERVNLLEGLVADSRRQPDDVPPATPTETLDAVIQTARREVDSLSAAEAALTATPAESSPEPLPSGPPTDDLAARRARLARQDPSQEE
ncbi:MAG: hypothetical protein JW910_05030, partial [Anaerolineae bacterium]|nr:hypothetical protein [Anaerolineae bacterium]